MAAERTVDAYVAALPDGQREIAEAVRRLVRSAAPEAREAFKWAQPVFESGHNCVSAGWCAPCVEGLSDCRWF